MDKQKLKTAFGHISDKYLDLADVPITMETMKIGIPCVINGKFALRKMKALALLGLSLIPIISGNFFYSIILNPSPNYVTLAASLVILFLLLPESLFLALLYPHLKRWNQQKNALFMVVLPQFSPWYWILGLDFVIAHELGHIDHSRKYPCFYCMGRTKLLQIYADRIANEKAVPKCGYRIWKKLRTIFV